MSKKKEPFPRQTDSFLSNSHHQRHDITMIRDFELFCKIDFKKISAMDLFNQAMAAVKLNKYKCPFCGSKHPDWKKHDSYRRDLISFENGRILIEDIRIVRYKCSSCNHSHALIPECIIPYQSYCLLFILKTLKDYYTRTLTVKEVCEKYGISASTLYAWKKLYERQKKIWLGLLNDAHTSSIKFLVSLFSERLFSLKEFFHIAGISFLQRASKKSHWNLE